MFTKALVKRPCKAMINGITSAPQLGKPDFENALRQHDAYIKALEQCGVSVTVLEADERFPDSCFIEDTAVVRPEAAVVSNPGASSRNGEKEAVRVALRAFFSDSNTHSISAPGFLDGGDVMFVEGCFYIGLSDRTNKEGAAELARFMGQYGYTAQNVELSTMLHLKTGVNYLGSNYVLVTGEFVQHKTFAGYKKIIVPAEEAYAANCLRVNDFVIVPEGFPKTHEAIKAAGFSTIVVDTSEYRKLDGGLSCLSLRF